jgi:hypothetical protein
LEERNRTNGNVGDEVYVHIYVSIHNFDFKSWNIKSNVSLPIVNPFPVLAFWETEMFTNLFKLTTSPVGTKVKFIYLCFLEIDQAILLIKPHQCMRVER